MYPQSISDLPSSTVLYRGGDFTGGEAIRWKFPVSICFPCRFSFKDLGWREWLLVCGDFTCPRSPVNEWCECDCLRRPRSPPAGAGLTFFSRRSRGKLSTAGRTRTSVPGVELLLESSFRSNVSSRGTSSFRGELRDCPGKAVLVKGVLVGERSLCCTCFSGEAIRHWNSPWLWVLLGRFAFRQCVISGVSSAAPGGQNDSSRESVKYDHFGESRTFVVTSHFCGSTDLRLELFNSLKWTGHTVSFRRVSAGT